MVPQNSSLARRTSVEACFTGPTVISLATDHRTSGFRDDWKAKSLDHFVIVELRKRMNGFSTKTRTNVNGFPHADPAVRARTHPARASVQRSLKNFVMTLRNAWCASPKWRQKPGLLFCEQYAFVYSLMQCNFKHSYTGCIKCYLAIFIIQLRSWQIKWISASLRSNPL